MKAVSIPADRKRAIATLASASQPAMRVAEESGRPMRVTPGGPLALYLLWMAWYACPAASRTDGCSLGDDMIR